MSEPQGRSWRFKNTGPLLGPDLGRKKSGRKRKSSFVFDDDDWTMWNADLIIEIKEEVVQLSLQDTADFLASQILTEGLSSPLRGNDPKTVDTFESLLVYTLAPLKFMKDNFANTLDAISKLKKALIKKSYLFMKNAPELSEALALLFENQFSRSPEQLAREMAQQEKLIEAKVASPMRITRTRLKEIVNELKASASFVDSFVLLQLCSGCRKIELLDYRVSQFSPVPDESEIVVQSGLAKRKKGDEDVVQKRILFMRADKWLELLHAFRFQIGEVEPLTQVELGARYARQLEARTRQIYRSVKGMFSVEGEEEPREHHFGTHLNRALYAQALVWQNRIRGVKSAPELILVRQALAHKRSETSKYYTAIELVRAKHFPDVREVEIETKKEDSAVFVTDKGKQIVVPKVKRQRRTLEQKRAVVSQAEVALQAIGKKPTYANLLEMGIGSDTIRYARAYRQSE